jgi:hypothetical protein
MPRPARSEHSWPEPMEADQVLTHVPPHHTRAGPALTHTRPRRFFYIYLNPASDVCHVLPLTQSVSRVLRNSICCATAHRRMHISAPPAAGV